MRNRSKRHCAIFIYLFPLMMIMGGCSGDSSHDTTPPAVESVFPANAEQNVILNTEIRARFSEPIDPSTVSTSTFTVTESGTNASMTGTVTYDEANGVATFHPAPQLNANRTYTAALTTGIGDLAQNRMAADYRWLFSTGTSVDISPPFFGSVQNNDPRLKAEATSSTTISLSWIAASDDTTPPAQMEYEICQATSPDRCREVPFPSSGVVVYRTAGGKRTFLAAAEDPAQPALTKNTTYYFVVRAIDAAGNHDANTAQQSARTPGEWASLGPSLNNRTDRDAFNPSIAVVGTTTYVAWEEWDLSDPTTGARLYNIYLRTFTEGGRWSPNPQANPREGAAKISQSGSARNAKLASNRGSAPRPYILYTECANTGQSCQLFVKRLNETGTWVDVGPQPVSTPGKNAGTGAIAFDTADPANPVPYVIFTEPDLPDVSGAPDPNGRLQVLVKHFDGISWVADGASLNADLTQDAYSPDIAIHSTTASKTIRAAWVECLHSSNQSNCRPYHKKVEAGNPAPTLLKVSQNFAIPVPGISLAFIDGVFPNGTLSDSTLFVTWHELDTLHVKQEKSDGSLEPVPPGSPITEKIQASSKVSIGGAGTGAQVPYLLVPADPPSGSSSSTSPSLIVKRLNIDSGGAASWVTEGNTSAPRANMAPGAINMAEGGNSQVMNSSIAFSDGTPYVAWMEKGNCINPTVAPGQPTPPSPCGSISSVISQIYVKRLE